MTRSTVDNEELAQSRVALAAAGVDVALLSSLANVTYASGWEAPVPLGALADLSYGQPLLVCSVSNEAAVLVVPDAYRVEASANAAVDEVIVFETFDSFRP